MPGVEVVCILLSFNPGDFNDAPKGVQTTQAGQAVILTGTGTNTVGDMPFIHRWTFSTGSGIANTKWEDHGG